MDVEEHCQDSALEPYLPRERCDGMESRVAANVTRQFDRLVAYGARRILGVLGRVAGGAVSEAAGAP